jgi:CHASE2 domain-containing sensor protein/tRNA A-37 threonylcarbamoyl transferase component Bud32
LLKFFTSHRWIALLMGSVLLVWSFCPGVDRLEQNVYSVLMGLVPAATVPVKTVVVTLNDDLQTTPSVSYPELSKLLDRLKSAGSKVIGLMAPLDHSQTNMDENALATIRKALLANKKNNKQSHSSKVIRQLDPDASLRKALRSSDRIVLAVTNAATEGLVPLAVEPPDNELAMFLPSLASPPAIVISEVQPLKMFSKLLPTAVHQTYVSKWKYSNVLAATPLAIHFDGQYLASFELLLAARTLGVPVKSITVHPGKGIMMGTAWVATDAGLRVYPRPQDSLISVFPMSEVLAGKHIKQLRDKIVLVGMDSGQVVQLPGSHKVSSLQGTAHAVNALVNESLVNVPHWALGVQRGGLILVMIYLLLIPVRLRGLIGLIGGLVLGFLILNGGLLMLTLKNTWFPLALPVLLLFTGQIMVWVHHRFAHSFSIVRSERDRALVELAANMRKQGKVDKAFDYLKGCSKGDLVMDGLYQVGLEYERRRQFAKALTAYDHIAQWNSSYRDISERRTKQNSLSKPAQEPGSLTATMVSHSATNLVVDDPTVEKPVLGRYEIESELGRGAMGTVYLGRDPRIGRTVAIKTMALTEEFESTQLDEVRRRFFQEAETAGRLGHPNIVTVYDVGEEHDLAYIAMDFIQGDSLDKHIRNGELLPLKDVFTIGIRVAEALDYAHEQSVVHRDVKPGNIIYDREKGQLKVTDFGIACLTDNSKTRTGTVLGSPYYMSPEQIAGMKVDGRSDLFSLGVTLYQLFSGQLPFEGDSLTSLMYQITNAKPKSVCKAQSDLPSCLTRIINKALEKKPLKRYVDGQTMAEALKRCAEQSGAGYYNE